MTRTNRDAILDDRCFCDVVNGAAGKRLVVAWKGSGGGDAALRQLPSLVNTASRCRVEFPAEESSQLDKDPLTFPRLPLEPQTAT